MFAHKINVKTTGIKQLKMIVQICPPIKRNRFKISSLKPPLSAVKQTTLSIQPEKL